MLRKILADKLSLRNKRGKTLTILNIRMKWLKLLLILNRGKKMLLHLTVSKITKKITVLGLDIAT